jgi:hypothetical protein
VNLQDGESTRRPGILKLTGAGILVISLVALGLVLAGTVAIALMVYLLVVATLILWFLVSRVQRALPLAPPFDNLLRKTSRERTRVEQLETIRWRLNMASYSEFDVHAQLRPLVREIVAARLSRHRHIDLDGEPARALAVIGEGAVWALIRPDRERPSDRLAPGFSESQLEQLIDELERL